MQQACHTGPAAVDLYLTELVSHFWGCLCHCGGGGGGGSQALPPVVLIQKCCIQSKCAEYKSAQPSVKRELSALSEKWADPWDKMSQGHLKNVPNQRENHCHHLRCMQRAACLFLCFHIPDINESVGWSMYCFPSSPCQPCNNMYVF